MWCCLHFRHACPTVRVCGHANARVKEKFQRTFTRICVGVWNHERACKEGGSAGGLEMPFLLGSGVYR